MFDDTYEQDKGFGRKTRGLKRLEAMNQPGGYVPKKGGHEYPPEYREQVFYIWYQAGRTSLVNLD